MADNGVQPRTVETIMQPFFVALRGHDGFDDEVLENSRS